MTPLSQEMPIATLIFDPPAWPVMLSSAAIWLLMMEIGVLVWRLRVLRNVRTMAAVALAAILAGPLAAAISVVWRIYSSDENRVAILSAAIKSCLHGSLIAISAGLLAGKLLSDATAGDVAFWSLAIIGWCVIAWQIRSYSRTTEPVSRTVKVTLLLIRSVSVAIILLWVATPTLQSTFTEQIRPMVLVGIDTSSSMRRADMPRNYSARSLPANQEPARRIDVVRQSLNAMNPKFESLAKLADVRFFTFSGGVEKTSGFTAADGMEDALPLSDAAGAVTAIGDSVRQAADSQTSEGKGLCGIVLISDGCNNASATCDPQRLANLMSSRGVAIYTVGVGSTTVTPSLHSLTVKSITAPDKAAAFSTISIQPFVESIGLAGRRIKLVCTFGDEQVASQEFDIAEDCQTISPNLTHIASRTGFQRLVVKAELLGVPMGSLSGRKSLSTFVQIQDNQIRILYIEGRFRYEARYIANALVSGDLAVDRRFLIQPQGKGGEGSLGDKLEDWLTYHAIILGDVPASQFTPKQLEIMKELVGTYGKGLAMIGGVGSFADGGWGKTPLADVMPVSLADSKGQISANIKIVPSGEVLTCPTMRLGDSDVTAAWAKLCPLLGANRLAGVKPAAKIWATAGSEPMIVVQQYGKGRSVAVAFDTTYQWVLSPDDTADLQKRFWRQMAMYLADPKGNIWVGTDKAAYDRTLLQSGAEMINISAGIEDLVGRPVRSPDFVVNLSGPGIASPIPVGLIWGGDSYSTRVSLPQAAAGVYTLSANGKSSESKLSAEHKFEITDSDAESFDILAHYQLLRRMSEVSGGKFAPLAEFDSLIDTVAASCVPTERQITTTRNISSLLVWPAGIIFIVLLCAEWFLRKKKGLV